MPVLAAAQPNPSCTGTGPTEPRLFHLPKVEHHEGINTPTYCETVIMITNLTDRPTLFQVQWFGGSSGPVCIQDNVGAGRTFTVATNPTLPLFPVFFQGIAWIGADINGQADVHASQHKMAVSAKLVCRDGASLGTSHLVAMTDLPVFDVR